MFEQLAFVRTQLSFLAITQLNKHNYKMSCVKIIKNNILTAILQSQIFILYKQLFLVPLFFDSQWYLSHPSFVLLDSNLECFRLTVD